MATGRMAPGRMATLAAATSAVCVAFATVGVAAAAGTTPSVCAQPPQTANRHATARAVAVHRYLLFLTCGRGPVDGVVSGQNVGHGAQAADTSGLLGYPRLVDQLAEQTGHHVGVVGVDYEHDFIFTPAQLSVANQVLVGHARRGGLVTVNWSPQSPWLNDESDIPGNPGVWTNTRTDNGQLDGVHLTDLFDPATAAGRVWQRKLTRIADALTELRDAGVVVLWRPMQEMNGFWFWWGTTLQPDDASIYIRLWRGMFQYFTQVRHLNNLLWVYSPSAFPPDPADQVASNIRDAQWSYPGSDYVDVVAGTSYNDDLLIPNYQDYLRLPEVIGEAEYDEGLLGAHDRNGDLDTTLYASRLRADYPAVAYWVSWHDFPWSATETAHLALVSNLRATDLLNDPYVINADALPRPLPGPRVDIQRSTGTDALAAEPDLAAILDCDLRGP
jgi:mannan endo-1,4-beta-mannosidase